ncbi:hypothetical protein D0C36_19970 [Mucilaginibacter conchicola]|uniref:Uncharacterized protein n=1 Tax=Mucilaginibacter conchicola TaxID=2303333 RepID=A0A372NQK1_9SPHI|nr:hypothetical protein [Mucilaginibacter conchicola]RFZ91216.1 hypothetical protein D0C36_19970 [Mucilaginibacter conchicola]
MNQYSAGRTYELLKKALMEWVWNNPRLLHKITQSDLEHLFEFDPQRGLSIDLRRFESKYYKTVFYPPEEKKIHIEEFVRKCCVVIRQNLGKAGKTELNITITVRHMISEVSHWHTFYIEPVQDPGKPVILNKKETDWHYRYES